MISLTSVAAMIKKIVAPVIVLVVVIILIIIIVLKFNSSKNPSENILIDQINKPNLSNSQLQVRSFNSQNLQLPQEYPKNLNVYTIAPQKDFLNQASALASALGYQQEPVEIIDAVVGIKIGYESDNQFLYVNENGFTFTNFRNQSISDGLFSDRNQLKIEAVNFLTGLNIIASGISDFSELKYYQLSDEFQSLVDDPSLANIVDIYLFYEIDGIRVLSPNNSIRARFTNNNELQEIIFNQFSLGDPLEAYPIITPEQALAQLNNNNGGLLNIDLSSDNVYAPDRVDQVTLLQTYLAFYRSSSVDALMQPIWVFEGKTNDAGENFNVTYAVPAIDSQYFSTP